MLKQQKLFSVKYSHPFSYIYILTSTTSCITIKLRRITTQGFVLSGYMLIQNFVLVNP
nr:MAG TPA: hypothetical protein [Caudoviricetes sp.]